MKKKGQTWRIASVIGVIADVGLLCYSYAAQEPLQSINGNQQPDSGMVSCKLRMIVRWQRNSTVLGLHSSAQRQFSVAMQVVNGGKGQAKHVAYELQAVCILTAQIPHQFATLTMML